MTFSLGRSFHSPLDGAISYSELSKKCGLEQSRLQRILRYIMTSYVFRETTDGLAHTSLSGALVADSMKMNWMGHILGDMFPLSGNMVEGFQKWPGATPRTIPVFIFCATI